jgi:hypothetical protein
VKYKNPTPNGDSPQFVRGLSMYLTKPGNAIIVIHKDSMKEYNFKAKITNFKFATEHKSSPMQPKKGDAYLYKNG